MLRYFIRDFFCSPVSSPEDCERCQLPSKLTMAKIQFVPFQSVIEPGFWHWLSTYKLEHLKLSEEPVELVGSYSYDTPDAAPRLRIDHCQGPAAQVSQNH
jgi:hypothetical protein